MQEVIIRFRMSDDMQKLIPGGYLHNFIDLVYDRLVEPLGLTPYDDEGNNGDTDNKFQITDIIYNPTANSDDPVFINQCAERLTQYARDISAPYEPEYDEEVVLRALYAAFLSQCSIDEPKNPPTH